MNWPWTGLAALEKAHAKEVSRILLLYYEANQEAYELRGQLADANRRLLEYETAKTPVPK